MCASETTHTVFINDSYVEIPACVKLDVHFSTSSFAVNHHYVSDFGGLCSLTKRMRTDFLQPPVRMCAPFDIPRLRDSVMTTSNGRMHIIVEGECTMHLNRYSSSSSSSSSSSTSSSISAALGLSPTDSSKAGNKKSGEAKKKEDIERTLGGAGPRYSTDNATIIARFGPGSVFWESAIFKDFRHDWHVIIRSATLRTYCIHRNDWNLLRYDADGTGVPIVSDKIKRSFRDEARFKMNYYTARAGTIADKIDVGARGNESSSSVAAGKSLS